MTEGGEDFGGVEFRFTALVATPLRFITFYDSLVYA
jgi:hypothetical protein